MPAVISPFSSSCTTRRSRPRNWAAAHRRSPRRSRFKRYHLQRSSLGRSFLGASGAASGDAAAAPGHARRASALHAVQLGADLAARRTCGVERAIRAGIAAAGYSSVMLRGASEGASVTSLAAAVRQMGYDVPTRARSARALAITLVTAAVRAGLVCHGRRGGDQHRAHVLPRGGRAAARARRRCARSALAAADVHRAVARRGRGHRVVRGRRRHRDGARSSPW